MKIFQVLNHFLPNQTAGTEVYAYSLSRELHENGISVSVVIPNYKNSKSEEYIHNGLRVHKYAEPSIVDRSLIMGFREPEGLSNFVSFLNEQKPDIVHFHELAGSNGITLHHVKAAKQCGAKVFFTFHLSGNTCKTGNLLYKEQELCDGKIDILKCSKCYLYSKSSPFASKILAPFSYLFFRFGIDTNLWNHTFGTALGTSFLIKKFKKNFTELVDNCDKLVVLTEWYKQVLLNNAVPDSKIELIPQALPISHFDFSSPSPSSQKVVYPIKLIFLGRISQFKGLHLLIEALQVLNPNNIELFIFGQGDGTDYEIKLKQKTANRKNIHWSGSLKQGEVLNTLHNFDALCLCSTFSEMSPLVIQEAFAVGLPVIASNVYGNAEQIKHNVNGLLFEYKNVSDLRHQIQRILDNPSILLDLRKNIIKPKTFETITNKYLSLYNKVLEN